MEIGREVAISYTISRDVAPRARSGSLFRWIRNLRESFVLVAPSKRRLA